jgi:hypothetical protein
MQHQEVPLEEQQGRISDLMHDLMHEYPLKWKCKLINIEECSDSSIKDSKIDK